MEASKGEQRDIVRFLTTEASGGTEAIEYCLRGTLHTSFQSEDVVQEFSNPNIAKRW